MEKLAFWLRRIIWEGAALTRGVLKENRNRGRKSFPPSQVPSVTMYTMWGGLKLWEGNFPTQFDGGVFNKDLCSICSRTKWRGKGSTGKAIKISKHFPCKHWWHDPDRGCVSRISTQRTFVHSELWFGFVRKFHPKIPKYKIIWQGNYLIMYKIT